MAFGNARKFGEVRSHLFRAERAVQADAERPRVPDGDIEGVEQLAGERPAAPVGDRRGDHQRQFHATFFERFEHRGDRRLGVQRVEDSLDQQEIGAAVDEAANLFPVRVAHLVECHRPGRRVVDVR